MLREEKKKTERKEVRITVLGKFTGKPFISALNYEYFSISLPDQKF